MKKISGEIMTILGVLLTALALVVGYGYHHFSKKIDSPVEQMAEAVIEKESGIQVDFSAEDKAKAAATTSTTTTN